MWMPTGRSNRRWSMLVLLREMTCRRPATVNRNSDISVVSSHIGYCKWKSILFEAFQTFTVVPIGNNYAFFRSNSTSSIQRNKKVDVGSMKNSRKRHYGLMEICFNEDFYMIFLRRLALADTSHSKRTTTFLAFLREKVH